MRRLRWLAAAAIAASVAASLPAGAAPGGGRAIRGGAPMPAMRLNPPSAMNAGAMPANTMPARPMPPAGGWGPAGWNGGPRPNPGMGGGMSPPPRPVPPVAGGGGWQGGPRPGQPGQPGQWHGGGRPGGWAAGNWNGPRPGGNWNGGRPGGWNGSYIRPHRGWRVPSFFIAPSFYISNWSNYGLFAPGYGQSWVRYYNDAVLVDRDGDVIDARYGLDWDRYDRGGYNDGRVPEYVGDVDDDDYYDRGPPEPPHPHPGYRPYPGDGLTWRNEGGVRIVTAAPGTTVVIQSAPSVVTTTTTTYVTERVATKKVWKKKAWRPAPKCTCR